MSSRPAFASEPLSIGGVIDAGVRFFRAAFKETLPVAAIAAVPYAVVAALLSTVGAGIEAQGNPDGALTAAVNVLILSLLMYVAISFLVAAVASRQTRLARGEPTTTGADIARGLKLAVPLTLMMIGFILVVTIGMVLLLIPGLILMVSTALFFYVAFMEDRSVWGGLGRSHALVWGGNWWRTAAVLTVISIIGVVLSVVFYAALFGVGYLQATSGASLLTTTLEAALNWAMMTIYMPFSGAMFLALYNDLLLRKEGGDLEARLSTL